MAENDVGRVEMMYDSLTPEQRQELCRLPEVGRFSDRLKAVWEYFNNFIDVPGFVHHAAVIARICDMPYESAKNKHDFKANVLSIYGEEQKDWKIMKNSEIFNENSGITGVTGESNSGSISIPVPGNPSEQIVISPGTNSSKFPMLTNKFARRLLQKSRGLGDEYCEFLLAIHDATYRLFTAGTTVPQASPVQDVSPSGWRDRIEYENAMVEIQTKRARLASEAFKDTMEKYRTVLRFAGDFVEDGGDERDRIWVRDMARNFANRMARDPSPMEICSAPTAMITSDENNGVVAPDPNEEEVALSDVVLEVFGKPLKNNDLMSIGAKVSAAYKAEFKEKPIKRTSFVDGAPRQVCSYKRKHIPIIINGINAWRAMKGI